MSEEMFISRVRNFKSPFSSLPFVLTELMGNISRFLHMPGPSADHVEALCALYASPAVYMGLQESIEEKDLTPAIFRDWYLHRAEYIESACGLVDAALDYLKLGKERNIQVSFLHISIECAYYKDKDHIN